MPNNNTATIFGPESVMSPTSDNALGFCQPMFEDIFVFSCELAASMERPPYYGDEIDLGFWEKLNMTFGNPDSPLSVVCMGDSLTEGYGGSGTNWPDVWASLSGYNVINKGVSGETSSQMLARFNTDVVAESPDYCIIECGTNDYIQGVSLSTCKSNIDSMVALCLSNNIEPRFVHYIQRENQLILAQTVYTISSISDMMQYLSDVWTYIVSLGYPCALLNEVTDYNIDNANMEYFYNTYSDYIHPNASGYTAWANYIRQVFNDMSSSSPFEISQGNGNNGVYPLYDGWLYRYYYISKRFVIKDSTDTVVYSRYDVRNISQFPIDFSVHKSHQFEIVISDASAMSTFLIPAILVKKEYGDSPTVNNGRIPVINNCYLPNIGDFSNYTCTDVNRLEYSRGDSYMEYSVIPNYSFIKYPASIKCIHGIVGIDFDNKVLSTQQLYDDNFKPFYAVKQPMTFRTMMLSYSFMLALLGLTMYPMLEPILRSGEEQNNRPVYEPWLIWGVFKFLGNHEYGGPYYPWDDEDTPKIDILNAISPNWSYG